MSRYSLVQGSLCIEPESGSTYEIRVMGVKKPVLLSEVTYTSEVSNIAFVHSDTDDDYITDGNNKFVTSPNIFKAGDMVRVSNSLTNDGEYLAKTVVLGRITLHNKEVLTSEGISANQITFTTVTPFEEDYQDAISSLAASRIADKFALGGGDRIARAFNSDLADLIAENEFQEGNFRAEYGDL
ncbi:MAG: hypothetical protein E3J60_04610 [Dehalococcoidia bacterium]|nr:MAG: hypothetical protein E3J60_04610 [Dehalococcoidia bacterium]